MARIRKFCAYRRVERPYTRISKFRKKSYVRTRPNSKIVRYHMGDLKSEFDHSLLLKSKVNLQVRDGSLEAARQTSNRYMHRYFPEKGLVETLEKLLKVCGRGISREEWLKSKESLAEAEKATGRGDTEAAVKLLDGFIKKSKAPVLKERAQRRRMELMDGILLAAEAKGFEGQDPPEDQADEVYYRAVQEADPA